MRDPMKPPEPVFTDRAPRPGGFYSQAVRAGDFLFISGQLPLDLEGRFQAQGIDQQARLCLAHVEAILRAAGGELKHLVQVTVYVSDVALWPEVNRVYKEVLKDVPFPPARAVVPVKDLHYGAQIEVQAVAFLGPAAAK